MLHRARGKAVLHRVYRQEGRGDQRVLQPSPSAGDSGTTGGVSSTPGSLKQRQAQRRVILLTCRPMRATASPSKLLRQENRYTSTSVRKLRQSGSSAHIQAAFAMAASRMVASILSFSGSIVFRISRVRSADCSCEKIGERQPRGRQHATRICASPTNPSSGSAA